MRVLARLTCETSEGDFICLELTGPCGGTFLIEEFWNHELYSEHMHYGRAEASKQFKNESIGLIDRVTI